MRTLPLLIALLFTSTLQAWTFKGVEKKPVLTPENGMSCGRTKESPEGVPCDVPQCYDYSTNEFSNWTNFEEKFLSSELNRAGILDLKSDFTEICAGYKDFSAAERKDFWLDFLRMTVAFESNFHTLEGYDDMIDGVVHTGRGFFSMGLEDCPGLTGTPPNYCKVHDPRINTKCALTVMKQRMNAVAGSGESTLDALAHHWGSMKSAKNNSSGGRRGVMAKTFAQISACTKVNSGIKYERLKDNMWTDEDWASAKIIPSSRPRKGSDWCTVDQTQEINQRRCERQQSWAHYEEVDRINSVGGP